MMQSWFEQLFEYDFAVQHRPGIQNILPDRLSLLLTVGFGGGGRHRHAHGRHGSSLPQTEYDSPAARLPRIVVIDPRMLSTRNHRLISAPISSWQHLSWSFWDQSHHRRYPRSRPRTGCTLAAEVRGSCCQMSPLSVPQHRQAWLPSAIAHFRGPAVRPCRGRPCRTVLDVLPVETTISLCWWTSIRALSVRAIYSRQTDDDDQWDSFRAVHDVRLSEDYPE